MNEFKVWLSRVVFRHAFQVAIMDFGRAFLIDQNQ